MSYSQNFIKALIDQNTDQVFLWLLTITHEATGETHRLVSNIDDIVSRGETYLAFPFEFVLPSDDGESLPEIPIVINYVSDELVALLRKHADGVVVLAEIILASAPDQPEYTIEDLVIKTVTYDAGQVTLTAKVEDLMSQRFPADDFLPRSFPGMFK